jgi:hypothetical protein
MQTSYVTPDGVSLVAKPAIWQVELSCKGCYFEDDAPGCRAAPECYPPENSLEALIIWVEAEDN